MIAARAVAPSLSPALRLLFDRGVCRRGITTCTLRLASRAGRGTWVLATPNASSPMLIASPGDARAMKLFGRCVLRRSRAQAVLGYGTWQCLRSREVIRGVPSRRSIELAERVLGRGLVRPALVLLSPSAAVNRATCFVFEGEEPDPTLVIHAMADPGRSAELATEMGRMERLRCELSGTDLNGTLPDPPLAVHRADGDVVVVEGFESRAAGGGVESRAAAWAWLARFQALLRGQARLVASAETAALLRRVEAAWVAAGSTDALPALLGALEALASAIVHVDIPRCAVHGDFWRGNISWANGRLRVYDWEWSSDTGLPTFDLWTYVLADLRLEHVGRHRRADRLVALTRELDRVATYLQQVGLPVELAALTAAPTLAELALRGEQRAGRPSDVAGDRWLFDAVSACVIRAASSRRATPVAAHPTRQELHV